jgi:cytochrome c oxidase subunit II
MFWTAPNTAGQIQSSFLIILGCAVFLLVAVTFFMLLFLVKYNHNKHPEPVAVKDSLLLEIVWTAIPTVIVLLLFYFGWKDFDYIRNPPKDSLPITVIARQWSWLFEYESGKQSDLLRVPINKPVRLILTSRDVIHSLFIPAFRIKEDCVPGLKTHLWFKANEVGSYEIFCTEYCGVGHSHMLSKVVVMPAVDFAAWYRGSGPESLAERGQQLLQNKGCLGCHSIDGSKKIGPTLRGVFGSKVIILTQGRENEILADEEYLHTMILRPGVSVVKGYPPIMPLTPLTEEELGIIINYLKGLK